MFSHREGITPKGPATPAPAWTHRLTAHWLHTAAGQGPLNSTQPRAPLDALHCPGAYFSPCTPGLPAAAAVGGTRLLARGHAAHAFASSLIG